MRSFSNQDQTPKAKAFKRLKKTEHRIKLAIRWTHVLLLVPILVTLGLLILAVVSNFEASLQRVVGFYKNNTDDVIFVATTYSLTVIIHFVIALFAYLLLVDSVDRGSRTIFAIKVVMRLGTGLPVALICLSIVWPLNYFGVADFLLKFPLFLSILFAISLLPTSVFLMCDVVPVAFKAHSDVLELAATAGIPRLLAIRRFIVFDRDILRYVANLSLFTSFRAIAELGFLKSILEEGRRSTLQQFIGNFYVTFRPDDFATIGISLFVVAILGVVVSLVVR